MEVGERKFLKFGETVDFDDALAKDVILGGGSIVPADHPASQDFTEQELSIYSNPLSHTEANAAFRAKKKRMLDACHEIRVRLQSGGTLAEPAAVEPAVEPAPDAPAN